MKKLFILAFMLVMAFTFAACGHRAETIDNKITGNKEPEAIEKSITLAARSLGWTVQPLDNQTMEATIKSIDESLTVLITYTPQSYVIQYKDSINLDFDARDNSIKKQYIRWVEDLDERIQQEIRRVK